MRDTQPIVKLMLLIFSIAMIAVSFNFFVKREFYEGVISLLFPAVVIYAVNALDRFNSGERPEIAFNPFRKNEID